MSGIRVKETMEHIHIPEEMRERIIRNIQDSMETEHFTETGHSMEKDRFIGHGRNRLWRGKRKVAVAAAIVLAAGIVGIPVQAIVRSFVMARMEEIPQAQVKDIVRMIEERNAEADSFSRELSDSEMERMKELRLSYTDGMFPEKTLHLVEQGEEMPEGTLCYVIQTGYFNLPEREMTYQ